MAFVYPGDIQEQKEINKELVIHKPKFTIHNAVMINDKGQLCGPYTVSQRYFDMSEWGWYYWVYSAKTLTMIQVSESCLERSA
mgnify:CR=1 FL=1